MKTAKQKGLQWEVFPPLPYVDWRGNLRGVTTTVYFGSSPARVDADVYTEDTYLVVGKVPGLEDAWIKWVEAESPPTSSWMSDEADFLRSLGYEVIR